MRERKQKNSSVKTDRRPYYDQEDKNRIFRSLHVYRTQHAIGIPTLCSRINTYLNRRAGGVAQDTVEEKTLQRFMGGKNVRSATLKLLELYAEHVFPAPPLDYLGESLANFFVEGLIQPERYSTTDEYLADNFVKEYDVFLEGFYYSRDQESEEYIKTESGTIIKTHSVKVYPDNEYIWEKPFEIPYGKIFFEYIPAAQYLKVTEFVLNENMSDLKDDVEVGGTDPTARGNRIFKGALVAASDVDLFAIVMRSADWAEPKFYILEPERYVYGEPTKIRFFGCQVAVPSQDRIATRVRSGTIKLVPVTKTAVGKL